MVENDSGKEGCNADRRSVAAAVMGESSIINRQMLEELEVIIYNCSTWEMDKYMIFKHECVLELYG